MNLLECIAIDDEPHALKILEAYVSKVPYLNLAAQFQSPLDAMPFLEKNQVDLIFLDIQMPELTGLQFLEVLQHRPAVILTTAYSEYALESYNYTVTDYLLKPYAFDRFLKAVNKVKNENSAPSAIEHSIENDTAMLIKGDAKHKYHQVELANITHIEGLRNYLAIHQKDGSKIVTLQSMRAMEEELPARNFLRIHKSFIVNMDEVVLIEGNQLKIGALKLPVGGSYREKLRHWIDQRK